MAAVCKVEEQLVGVDKLFTSQVDALRVLVMEDNNVFLSAPTSSGKTLIPVVYPLILSQLSDMGYNVPKFSRVLFVTAMNSIQISLEASILKLGVTCASVTRDNIDQILDSKVYIILVGPEVLKHANVSKSLLKHRDTFCIKIIDEAHLGKILSELKTKTLIISDKY